MRKNEIFITIKIIFKIWKWNNIYTVIPRYIRVSLRKNFCLAFHQRCTLTPRSQNIFHILLYQACGKWYFQSKIGRFGPIQASRTKLKNGVSLSTGIVEQNVRYVLWSWSQCASLVKCKAKDVLYCGCHIPQNCCF